MLPFGFLIGGLQERRHLNSLTQREAELAAIQVCNLKNVPHPETVTDAGMVMGHVVIASDYYKSFATSLRNLFGGQMKSAESLMTRARRESLVRLKQNAQRAGAAEVWNLRFAFSNISQMRGRTGNMQVELLAYGTAIRRG